MRLHSVFLRKGCILPECLDPLTGPVGDQWKLVDEIPARVFDTMIRQAGWHFMWIRGSCSGKGFAMTEEKAKSKALTGALNGVAGRNNAAELDSVQIAKYPGFYVATVTLQPRQIQQHTALDDAHEEHPRMAAAK